MNFFFSIFNDYILSIMQIVTRNIKIIVNDINTIMNYINEKF